MQVSLTRYKLKDCPVVKVRRRKGNQPKAPTATTSTHPLTPTATTSTHPLTPTATTSTHPLTPTAATSTHPLTPTATTSTHPLTPTATTSTHPFTPTAATQPGKEPYVGGAKNWPGVGPSAEMTTGRRNCLHAQ
ncbi:uncharacterized protein [Penaeus vannamei]|uniref:uncharacterized protein n=1 Tax=Penaeus vannamei TaxID=6689 RepID=UPI00387F8EE0